MFIAVSGISRTLTRAQHAGVCEELAAHFGSGDTLVTGGAYGVDTAATIWAASEGIAVSLYVPADLVWNRGLADIAVVEVCEVTGSYMDRNEAIAESPAERLLAFPISKREARSGTMATVRRFEARCKPTRICALGRFK